MIICYGINKDKFSVIIWVLHRTISRFVLSFASYYFFVKGVKGVQDKKEWKLIFRAALLLSFLVDLTISIYSLIKGIASKKEL